MGKKKKVMLPPQLPAEINDEEIEVSDEDIDFVIQNPKSAGFLTQLDTKEIDRYVSRVADRKDDDGLEARYERRNRKSALQDSKEENGILVDSVDALPIKTLDGKLEYRIAKVSTAKDEADKQPTDEVDNAEEKSLVKLTKAERRQKLKKMKKEAKKQKKEVNDDHVEDKHHSDILAEVEKELSAEEQFTKKKLRLAELGKQLLENPESCIGSLKELLDICNDKDHNIIVLGLFSLLAVFKDIIPGYRIRLPTEKELEMVVSKVVKQTRVYETTLLRSYKAYLLRLVALEKKPIFHRAAVRCMCDLLITVPHFNFRDSLLVTVVKNLNSSDDVVRKYCREAIKSTFVNEGKHGGEATLEAVRLIAAQVKQHNCELHPDCLDVFLSLKFDEDLGKPDSEENEKVRVKGKKRKWRRYEEPSKIEGNKFKKSQQELRDKTREEVSADLKSVSFTPDKEDQRRMQSATLAAVFETYFRILKRSVDVSLLGSTSKSVSSSNAFGDHPLLAPCLSGLARFSHLIDVGFMGDLMGCLKKLAGYDDNNTASTLQNNLSVSERLQCCTVAFKVMRSNLDALNVDLQEFFVQLYNLLLEYRPNRDRGEVLAEALKVMLWEGKQHDMQRAAAFVKRLATFTLSFGSAEAMAALVTVKHLLLRNAKCRRLLENDAGGGSLSGLIGKYQADAWDPNLSGALASVLWELSLLSKHYNPTISSMASSISTMASMDPSLTQAYLSNSSPVEAFNDSSFEKSLSKPIPKPPSSINRKRKRNKNTNFVSDTCISEDEIKSKLEDHFTVIKNITENERLRKELNRTMASISLYEKYAQQKKNNKAGAKASEKKRRAKLSDAS